MKRALVTTLWLAGALAASGGTSGDGPVRAPAAVGLRDAKIDDGPLTVSVPLSKALSLVVALPEHYWMLTARLSPHPLSLEGTGFTLRYIANLPGGGYRALVFMGSVPLPEAKEGEKPEARFERGAVEFVATLGEKYKPMDEVLLTGTEKIKLKKSVITVDGRKAPVLRSTLYNTQLRATSARAPDMMTNEALFIMPPGAERLAYIVVDMFGVGTSLEKVVASVSVQPTIAVNRKGHASKLIEGSASPQKTDRYRFAAYDEPAFFVANYDVRAREDVLYAADRFDLDGTVTATYRVSRREPGEGASLDDEGRIEAQLAGAEVDGAPTRVDLATKGAQAVVYSYKTKLDEKDCVASTAVFRFEDQVWSFTWWTFGDAARAAADRAAFRSLLGGMQLAER